MYKSPPMPCDTASPFPDNFIISPFWMPAGIFTATSSFFFKIPYPLQTAHGFSGILPFPWHLEHSLRLVNVPKKERLVSLIVPDPWQIEQFFKAVSGSAPFPRQVSQNPGFVKTTLRSTPNTDSLKDISISIEISLPLFVFLPFVWNPPKKSSKISVKSNPPLNCESKLKSKPASPPVAPVP